jgi:hypothetical protein
MNTLYKFYICYLLLLGFHTNASVSEEQPNPKSAKKTNSFKVLDCGIPTPTIVSYGCLGKIWDKQFGGEAPEYASKILKVSGGYLLAGSTNPSTSGNKSAPSKGGMDYWLVKIDDNGNKIWDKTFGGSATDFLTDIIELSDGNFVMAGGSYSGIGGDKTEASRGGLDYWLVKIDDNGNKIWDKTYGGSGDEGYFRSKISVKETNDGFVLGGSSLSGIGGDKTTPTIVNGSSHIWLLKLNHQGTKIWEKTFGGSISESFVSISILENNEYLLLGNSLSPSNANIGNKTSVNNGGDDYWLVKVNANGDKVWDRSYGGNGYDRPSSMVYTNDGKVVIIGSSDSNISGDKSRNSISSSTDLWVIKVDTSGNKYWDKTYGGSSSDFGQSIIKTPNGGYIVSSTSDSYKSFDRSETVLKVPTPLVQSTDDYWILELNESGEKLWDKSFGGPTYDESPDVIIDGNSMILAGSSMSKIGSDKSQNAYNSSSDFWVVKMSYCQPNTSNLTIVCKNDSTFLTAQGCPNASTVKWSNNATSQTISVKPSTNMVLKAICVVTQPGGVCQGDSSLGHTINTTIITSPNVSVSNSDICVGDNTILTASGCQGTYVWTGGLTTSSITVSPITTKTYRVACMSNGCTSDSAAITILVNSAPIISSVNQTICAGQSTSLSATGCTNGILKWTGGLTGTTITVTPLNTSSTYRVACQTINCLSDSSASTTISVISKPAPPTIINYNCLKKVWDKRFGGADGPDYEPKLLKVNGGYLLSGTSRSSSSGDRTDVNRGGSQNSTSADYWVIKIDDNGNKIWDKAYGGAGDEFLSNIISLSDGNYLMSGWSNSEIGGEKSEASRGGKDYWIVKIDANGNKIWDKTYGGSGDEAWYENMVDVKETSDGFILGGSSISGVGGDKTLPAIVSGYYHFWILKLNQQGGKVWEKTFGGNGGEVFTSLEVLENNEYLLLGQSKSSASTTVGNKTSVNKGNSDYWLVKINSNGDKIWDRSYGGTDDEYAKAMSYTNDGKVTIIGTSSSLKSFDKSRSRISSFGREDIWMIRVDTSGTTIWDKTYGGGSWEYANKFCMTKKNQGGYIVTASSYSEKGYDKSENTKKSYYGDSTNDYWIFEIDENGEKLWDKTFGGNNGDIPYNVVVENDAVIISGISFSSGLTGDKSQPNNGPGNFWLVKMGICQPIVGYSTTICKNDSTFLTVQGCPNASTVKWSNGETVQTISVKPTATTTYKAVCISTDPGTCQSDSSLVFTVNVNAVTPPTLSATSTSICIGESSTITASGCSGTLGWTSGGGGTSLTVNPTVTKTYKVACNFNACKSDSASITITVSPSPTKPTITTASQNICLGSSVNIFATGCSNGIYQWTGGLTGSSIMVTPVNIVSSYKVSCKVSTCVSDSSTAVTITAVTKPASPVINPLTNSTICQGQSITLTANGCSGETLAWTGGLSGTSVSVTPTATRSYKVACTVNGCVSDSSSATTITVNPKPARPTILSTGNTVCQGINVILTVSACLNGTYGWTGGATTSSITLSAVGTRAYKVACTINGCTSDSSLVTTVIITSKPSTPTISNAGSSTVCQGNNITLTASACSGGTLGWTGGLSGTSITISSVGIRIYKVACTINGCTSDSSSATSVTINPRPAQPIINQTSQSICAGQTVNLTVTPVGTNTYGWTSGLTGTSISVSPISTRSYRLATSANGCTSDSTNSVTITVQANSTSPATTGATVCQGGTLTVGNGLKSTIPNCSGSGSSSSTATYSGGTVGYDSGSSSGANPTATISGMTSTITKVRVSITWLKKGGGNQTSCGTAHNGGNPYHSETSFRVQSPDGTIINLVNSGTYGGSTTSIVTTVFEDGFSSVSSGIPPVSGTFSPASSLSGFNGKAPNGAWTLLPNDNGSGDPLCVSGFSVTVTAGSVAVPSTVAWWDAQTGGNQLGTGSEFLPTTNILASGTYTYYTQASCSGVCPSTRVAAVLTIMPKPSTPSINPPTNSTICRGSSIILSATGCAGTYTWTGGLTGSSVSVSPTATTNYTVNCTVGNCTSNNSSVQAINVINVTGMESTKSGSWIDPTTWSCNRVPTSTDDIIINSGHTITDNGNTIRAKTLNYRGGILQFSQATNFILGN